jgi:hypothetical protein
MAAAEQKVQAILEAGDDPFALLVRCNCCPARGALIRADGRLTLHRGHPQKLPGPQLDALDRPKWDVEDSTITRQYRRVRCSQTCRGRTGRCAGAAPFSAAACARSSRCAAIRTRTRARMQSTHSTVSSRPAYPVPPMLLLP